MFPDAKLVRSVFLNLDSTLKFVDLIVERASTQSEEGKIKLTERELEIYKAFAEEQVRSNFQTIHKFAKSPIEIIFLSTLHMSFAMTSPLLVEFTPPIKADTFPAYLRENHAAALQTWEQFKIGSGCEDVFEFLKTFDEIYGDQPDLLEEIKHKITRHIILYNFFDLYNKYHLSLQPSFTDLKVNGRRIKPDLFIWIPAKPEFKLIVECDGYNTHSSKEAFSKDRAKDRELQRQGYKVFRFSGQDIYKDPVGQSMELFDYLLKLEGYEVSIRPPVED